MQEQDNKESQNKESKGKFNFNWLFIVLAFILLGMLVVQTFVGGETSKISYDKFFKEILPLNDVEKIAVVNNKNAEN